MGSSRKRNIQRGKIDSKQNSQLANAVTISGSVEYHGPLPLPSDFKQYGDVLANAPERILSMAEKEQDSRIKTDNRDSLATSVSVVLVSLSVSLIQLIAAAALFASAFTGNVTAAVMSSIATIVLGAPKLIASLRKKD
jgi:uncharacterized membrane protein